MSPLHKLRAKGTAPAAKSKAAAVKEEETPAQEEAVPQPATGEQQ